MNKFLNKEKLIELFFLMLSVLSISLVFLICLFIFKDLFSFLSKVSLKDFLFSSQWSPVSLPPSYGILSMVLGSIIVTVLSTLGAVPVAVMVASYLSFDCPPKMYKILKPALNLMTGIPSIVYGFFALTVLVPLNRSIFGGTGANMLTASILLMIMILPTIISMAEVALRAVPKAYYQGSLALGASHDKSITRVVLPAAKSGIFAGVILGIGRAIGETMAVMLVAGNQTRLTFNILKGMRTMTTNIVMEMAYASGDHRQALIATGGVLFIFTLIINIGFFMIKKRSDSDD